MKDKLSKPDKMTEALDSLDQYINNLIKKHEQEMQRVVDENERLRNGCRDDETRCPYYDLKDKVKQLEQQIERQKEQVQRKENEILKFIRWNQEKADKITELEQQIKESREVSVEEIEEVLFNILYSDDTDKDLKIEDLKSDKYYGCEGYYNVCKRLATAIHNLIYGDKQ